MVTTETIDGGGRLLRLKGKTLHLFAWVERSRRTGFRRGRQLNFRTPYAWRVSAFGRAVGVGLHRKWPALPWSQVYLGGHLMAGPVVLFGFNAMHITLQIRTRRGYLCIHPTIRMNGARWPWYVYLSPDGTPRSASWSIGPGMTRRKVGL